jgi:hypothetical protein
MSPEFVKVLREKIRTDMNNYADDLSSGTCKSFDDYKHLCGVIQGLSFAERHLIDLVQIAEKADM